MSPEAYRVDALLHINRLKARWLNIQEDFDAIFIASPTDLARENFGYTERRDGHMVVSTHPIQNEVVYMTAMHEIGHIASGHFEMDPHEFRSTKRRRLVLWEIQAWQWAFANSIIPLTGELLDNAVWALGTYLRDHSLHLEDEWYDLLPAEMLEHPALYRRELVAA